MNVATQFCRGIAWIASAAAVIGLGCKEDDAAPPKRTRVVRVAIIGEGKDEPTWPVIQATAAEFAKKYAPTTVDARAPETSSPSAQQDLLEAVLKEQFDAVCLHASDPITLRGEVDQLAQRGLCVVTFGRDVMPSKRMAYCGPSEFEIGRAAVQSLGKVLENRNKTVMLLHAGAEDDVYSSRYFGFIRSFSQTGGIRLLREVNCHGNPIDAVRLVKAETRLYPRAGCWVFLDDWPVRALGRDEQLLPLAMTIVLCNGSPRYLHLLRDGRVQAMIAYDYQRAVDESLFAAVRLVEEKQGSFSSEFAIPSEIITERELPAYEARWERWRHGMPSGSLKPQ